MMTYFKEHAVNVAAWNRLSEEQKVGKFIVGELYKNPRPEYTAQYDGIIESLSKEV